MKHLDIARALKDKDYFNSLTPEQQAVVTAAGGVGLTSLGDEVLESVSGGLEGGVHLLYTSSGSGCAGCVSRAPGELQGRPSRSMPMIVCVC